MFTPAYETDFGSYLSKYDRWCQGVQGPDRYFVAFNVTAAKAPQGFGHESSSVLDETNAFDLAEIARMNLGQLNLVQVSSFCGPDGLIWGYDAGISPRLRDRQVFELVDAHKRAIPVFSAAPLMESAQALFGTVGQPNFPIMPGSICPAAWKKAASMEPAHLFSALAIGIPENRSRAACTLMEDAGRVTGAALSNGDDWRKRAMKLAAQSVLGIMANQRSVCREIFVSLASVEVGPNEVGCALLLAPYFSLAKQAAPRDGWAGLKGTSIAEWQQRVGLPELV